MSYLIDKNGKTPAYIQLYSHIKRDIICGAYAFGSKLPSKRTMATDADVSVITVENAYGLLCDEGYIEAAERSGYYVVFRSTDGFYSSGENAIGYNAAHSVHSAVHKFPFSVLSKTMRKVMSDYDELILDKSPNAGSTELREAIRKYLARNRNIYADTNQIVIGSGEEYLYGIIVGILGRDKTIALEYPSYSKISEIYKAAGANCDYLPLGAEGIESYALSETKASVLHISPYRSFPSGVTASASKKYEYLRWAEQENHFIIEDDFASEFSVSSKPEERLFAMSASDNVIYLNSFSNTVSPAMRVGYMILPEKLISKYTETVGFYSCTVPTFEQLVLAKLIDSGDFERHINRVRRQKRKMLQE